MRKLSACQKVFLYRTIREGAYRTPFTGGRGAGRVAAAWYRTAESLAKRGLLTMSRSGDAYEAVITDSGERTLQASYK